MTRHETTTTQNDLWFLLFQLSLTARISLNKRFMAFVLQSMYMASYGVSACWSINRTSDSPFSNSRVSRIKGRSSNGEIVDWVTQWLTHCFTNRLSDSLTEGGPGTPPSVICRQSALFFLCSNRILWGEYKTQQCCVMWGEVLTQLLSLPFMSSRALYRQEVEKIYQGLWTTFDRLPSSECILFPNQISSVKIWNRRSNQIHRWFLVECVWWEKEIVKK